MESAAPASSVTNPARGSPAAEEILLPVAAVELQAAMAAVYQSAVDGASGSELIELICVEAARRLAVPLVMLLRKSADGVLAIEGASPDGALCLAFHRVPESWDGGVTSHGPAAAALAADAPVRMSFTEQGLSMWREAAARDRVQEVVAVPLEVGDKRYVMEIFGRTTFQEISGRPRTPLRLAAQGFATLLAGIERIREQRLLAQALEAAGNAAFVTDAQGTILWSNPAFTSLTGYGADEVRGRNPSLLRSGVQGLRYYRDLWSTIRSGRVWSGETVDRDKDGNLYTIRQTVSPVASGGRITHYVSIHEDVSQQKRDQQSLELTAGVDPRTGLMTRAAFEQAARDLLSSRSATQGGAELVLLSLRGLRRASACFDDEVARYLSDTMGRRVREAAPAPHLAAATGLYEYAILLGAAEAAGDLIADLKSRLGDPILYLGESIDIDLHVASASDPSPGQSLEELWARADRQLADEPIARAHPPRVQ